MRWRRWSKKLRYGIGRVVLAIATPVIALLPLGFFPWLSRGIVWCLGNLPLPLSPFERNILDYTGTEMSPEERRRLALKVAANVISSFFESIHAYFRPPSDFLRRVRVQDDFGLRAFCGEGKGAILISAHFGPFPLLQLALAKLGYPLRFLIKLPNNEWLAERYKATIAHQNLEPLLIPRRIAPKQQQALTMELVRCLKAGELVCLFVDEPEKEGGIPVRFLNRAVCLPGGPAVLHARYGFPIIPVYIFREDGHYTVRVEHPVETGPNRKDIPAIAQACADRLTAIIRKYPEHWSWLSKPREAVKKDAS